MIAFLFVIVIWSNAVVTRGTWSIELKPLYIFGCESKRCKNDVSSDGLNDEEEEEEEEEEVETNSLSKLVAALEAVVIVVTCVIQGVEV